jgi:hypothetical protein
MNHEEEGAEIRKRKKKKDEGVFVINRKCIATNL